MGKEFYVAEMYGEEGVLWSAENFTDEELAVIDRFLNELNKHASTKTIDCVVIFNDDEF